MTTITDAYINALLADASYVGELTPKSDLRAALQGRMTPALAITTSLQRLATKVIDPDCDVARARFY